MGDKENIVTSSNNNQISESDIEKIVSEVVKRVMKESS